MVFDVYMTDPPKRHPYNLCNVTNGVKIMLSFPSYSTATYLVIGHHTNLRVRLN